jgi:hypothetical protein
MTLHTPYTILIHYVLQQVWGRMTLIDCTTIHSLCTLSIGMGADDIAGDPRPQSLAMVCGSLRLLMANAKDSASSIDVASVMGSMKDGHMAAAAARTKREVSSLLIAYILIHYLIIHYTTYSYTTCAYTTCSYTRGM